MTKSVLGISAFYHDAAAAIVHGSEVLAAAQEERFTRKKHDPRFPRHAVNYCLEEAFLEGEELDAVVFYDNPLLTLDRVVKNCMQAGASSAEQFAKASRSVLGVKLWVEEYVERTLGGLGKAGRLLYTEHHMAHGASAFYPSPFQEAAIMTLDGVGEWCTTTIGYGEGQNIELFAEIDYPHSVGLLYSAFTYFCGFKVNSGEYKLMGLAPYGTPRYVRLIKDHLIDIKDDGSYRLNMDYFGYVDGLVMTNDKFSELFHGAPRRPDSRITRRERDIAASIQEVTNEIVIKIARHAKRETGSKNLVMAGGVALNCVSNGLLLREGIFDRLWIQPAAGDAGGALGAALLVSHTYFGEERRARRDGRDGQSGSYLGPEYSASEIEAFLDRYGYPYDCVEDDRARAQIIARALEEGMTVGFFSGRMEFGPRALGARSILGDPRRADTQSKMNLKVKYRESFRPFAPAVLEEEAEEYFEIQGESPYMLLVVPVRKSRRLPMDKGMAESEEDMIRIVNQPRSDLPAITHIDYSARVQTVSLRTHEKFHKVIEEFRSLTDVGVVVNTSFNVRGEPIVCSPKDAYRCFMRTGMDLLALEHCLLWKERQPVLKEKQNWMTEYEKD
ncbi:MAG: hypothetical protein GWN84_03700 [Gammaproteobacteria bacterium]|nr:hypothetical protein [Gammaproteobacteria bacterium]NIR90088.1 hypothetical protein [Gammaproteobacteria bacterium]NIU03292.1 hypothetical protein [Gammaproteobacteria bacterium]NIV50786.1 hypothetical protein [Gammaproteobacteria bacterium]NIV75372.1 hypothetical protein [Gammaproteobacteria bacterium]